MFMRSNRPSRLMQFFTITGLLMGLSACGYKGGLYMPAPTAPSATTQPQVPAVNTTTNRPDTPTAPAKPPATLGPASTPLPPVTQIRGK
ncbi:MAG: hypothetical protein GX049_10585 [Alcaligenaceae bacterium]|nr:hypothetical protein [Alcaligenaceae bacterium]